MSVSVPRLVVLVLAALCLLAPSPSLQAADRPAEVTPMDLFRIINGGRDRVVVVSFFATWCPPCLMEIPGLMELRRRHPESALYLVGISFDSDSAVVEKFLQKNPLNYPVKMGTADVAQAFQAFGLPKLLVYGKGGVLALNHDGFLSEDDLRKVVDPLVAR